MVMRLPSRFMATRSGTVTFFGAGVEVPPYWSLMSNLRPGRLRAGPGVNAILSSGGISHDSLQIAEGRQQKTGERQRDRNRARDHENEGGSLALREERRSDRYDRREQRSAEIIDARHAAQKSPRHVDLQRGDPEDTEAREAQPVDRAGDQSAGDRRHEPVHEERDPHERAEEIHRDATPPDAHLCDRRGADRLTHPDARADDPVRDGTPTEGCRHKERKRNGDRADAGGHDERPAEARHPEP